MPSFDDFLRMGRIGRLVVGISQERIRELVGEPPDRSVSQKPPIWKYGPVELVLDSMIEGGSVRLAAIRYQCWSPDRPPAGLGFKGWLPTPPTNFSQFLTHLDEANIEAIEEPSAGPERYLIFEAGLRATFDEDEQLWSVATLDQFPAGSNQVPVSVLIHPQNWWTLDREAQSRGISIEALCSHWITERVEASRASNSG